MAQASSIRVIQTTTYTINDLNGASQQIAIPATAIGNTLVVFVAINQTNVTASHATAVADSGANTYTQQGTTQTSGNGAGHVQTQIFTSVNAAASATWFTITTGASGKQVNVSFVELAGVVTVSAIDATNGGTATAATAVTASNLPTTLGDVVLLYAATGGASMAHVQDGTSVLCRQAAPYPTGTAGAGCISSVAAFIGAPTTTMVSSWTSAVAGNFAWSSLSLKAATPGTGPLYQVFSGYGVSAADINQIINTLTGQRSDVPIRVANRIQAGLTGATAQNGFCGGTASGAPVTGTFLVGDWVIDQTGFIYICITAGTPGTWQRVGSGGYFGRCSQITTQSITGSASMQSITGMQIASGGGYDPKSMFSGANNGFTIPFSGSRWRVIAGQHVNVGSNSGEIRVSILKNGTAAANEISRGYDGPTIGGNGGGIVSDILTLSSGDVIRAGIVSTATGNTVGDTAGAANYLCVALADA